MIKYKYNKELGEKMDDIKENVYKKLFNIHYNNKTFAIFIDKYGRRTFLEVNELGEYVYPHLDDFVVLHKIYNEKNPFISHDIKKNQEKKSTNPSLIFKEFVHDSIENIAIILVSVNLASLFTSVTMSRVLKLVKKDDHIEIVADYVDGTLITHTNELDSILGYKAVSIEEVINAINSNTKIEEHYKSYAINLATFLKNKYPDTDQRIFYENMKRISVKKVKNSHMSKYVAGTYNCNDNKISIREDHDDSEEVITHEFAHSYHNWKEKTNLTPKYRVESYGNSLDEAMTNKIINGIVPTTTYRQVGKVLDYFQTCVAYDYYDYEREGIAKLISLLKEKCPTVDIDYIINSIDAMNDTEINTGEVIRIEETSSLLDEMFNICICNLQATNISSNSVYQPFVNFLKLIDCDKYIDVAEYYLKEYNNLLSEKGYQNNKIQTNITDFTFMLDKFNIYRKDFREHVDTLDINNISKDNIYEPFKKYLQSNVVSYHHYISEEEISNLFCDLLDTYNDFLYCNGYTRNETISKESVMERVNRYKNIRIAGYDITNEDILYPVVDIPDADKVYNTSTKVPVLNNDGKIILLDKKDIASSFRTEDNEYQHSFIRKLFETLEQDTVTFSETTWQQLFRVYPATYKKVTLYLDDTKLVDDYLFDVNITIGQKEDGTNTFSLSSQTQSIYQDDANLKEVTIPLLEYLGNYVYENLDITTIDLAPFLSEDYLKELIAGKELSSPINKHFGNFTYDKENDTVNVHPTYYVTIDEDGTRKELNSIYLNLSPNETYLVVDYMCINVEKYVDDDGKTEDDIYLETVLDYYGILSEEQQDYYLSQTQILELYNSYSHDVYIDKNDITNSKNIMVTNNLNNMSSSIKR